MNWHRREPQSWPERPGVAILEAEAGDPRDAVVTRWLAQHPAGGAPAWRLRCGGDSIWAGLDTLLDAIVPLLRERAPQLLERHGQELCLVLPALRPQLDVPRSLTETVAHAEKTRNYAADRAYRSLHGVIDLLATWHALTQPGPWMIACEDFDQANGLVRRFFHEFVRRRGELLGLRLLLVVSPPHGAQAAQKLDPATITAGVRLALTPRATAVVAPAAMTHQALQLERALDADPAVGATQLPSLVDAWRRSEHPERALSWQVAAMEQFNHAGLYEASLTYAAEVEAAVQRLADEDLELYHRAINALYFCYVALDRPQLVKPILEQVLLCALPGAVEARYCYLLAMLHTRFLTSQDQSKAEGYLRRALDALPGAQIADDERHFLTVFTMNGLALVRLRQRRVPEALELCRAGVARLNEHLHPERHRLHRSVLLFNIAQVYAQTGPYDDALEYFSQAMAMDPNYSEYYNDRGSVHLRMEHPHEAERDYLRAIELSPPYAEVWANLGQCYRAMDRMADAVHAYSRALDLDPDCLLAHSGRAEALVALDRAELALRDYARALSLEPRQPHVLAGRAIVHYEAGRVGDALADLDAAIGLAPDLAELYQNRAVALEDLGRREAAAIDLSRYLELCPDAEDRGDVEATLSVLTAR